MSQIEHGKLPEPWHRKKWALAYRILIRECEADLELFERLVCEGRDGWELPLFRYAIVEHGALGVIAAPFARHRQGQDLEREKHG